MSKNGDFETNDPEAVEEYLRRFGDARLKAEQQADKEKGITFEEVGQPEWDAYEAFNSATGHSVEPVLSRKAVRREASKTSKRREWHINPWQAGTIAIVGVAALSATVNHFLSVDSEVESQSGTLGSHQTVHQQANIPSTGLEDGCYEHPMSTHKGLLRTDSDGTIRVISNADQIRVGAVDKTVLIPRGVNVGVITVCGAVNRLKVEGAAERVAMYGAEVRLNVADGGTVASGALEGAEACVSGEDTGQIYAPRC